MVLGSGQDGQMGCGGFNPGQLTAPVMEDCLCPLYVVYVYDLFLPDHKSYNRFFFFLEKLAGDFLTWIVANASLAH